VRTLAKFTALDMERIRWYLPELRTAFMTSRLWTRFSTERLRLLHCVYGGALVALISAIGETAPADVTATHLALIYLLAVFVVAVSWGLWPALLTAVWSVAALDYLFLPPLYSFEVDTPQDYLLLALLSVVAIIASGLAAQLREQVTIAERNAETTAALYRFAGKLAGTLSLDAAVSAVVNQVAAMLPYRVAIYFDGETPPSAALILPLRSADENIGLIAIATEPGQEISADERRLIEALAELAGIALGRQVLSDRLARLSIEKEADRLRSALLDSIAHDLTAPIASVATALTSLAGNYDAFDDTTRRELIDETECEARRLHRFSADLIHIARIEAGVVDMRREASDIADLVSVAVARARGLLAPRRILVDIPPDLPLAAVDFSLLEQALFHLLDNAGKYTPVDAVITVTVESDVGGIVIKVADDGPGFPLEDSERIFTKFYRSEGTIGGNGTGLGLAICRGFIEAHGGTVTARNRADGSGAIFIIFLPYRAASN
jgi:two-component system, OmpR family, sensor histidine kinase KdpD